MKRKFRSLLSMTLALMMIISAMSFATVSAADKGVIDGLYVDYSGESTVTYATDMAYSGSRSIAIDAKSGSHVWMGDPVGDFGMDPTKAYGLEFYIYVDSWTSGKIWLKPTGNDNTTYPTVYYASLAHGGNGIYLEDTNKGRWGLEKIESGEKAGWYRVWNTTAIIAEDGDFSDVSGYGKGYMWYTDGEMKVKLDNINVYEWTGYTTTQNSGTRGETPVFTQDFEEEINTEPSGPVIPDAADLDTQSVNLTSHENTAGTYGVTDTFAHGGEHSLYVDSTSGIVGLGSCADDFNMVKGTPYGFKFSIYIAENESGQLQIRPQNGSNTTYSAVYYTLIAGTSDGGLNVTGACNNRWNVTKDENTGWYSFESIYPIMVENTAAADFISGSMFYFEGKFKAFIDDVEIYNWTKEPVSGSGIANGMGTTLLGKRDFEPANEPEEPSGPVIPDTADLDTNVGLFKHSATTGTYGVTNTFAHGGEHSLYVDSTTGAVGLGSCADDFEMEEQTAYGIQFSIYIAENQSGLIQIKPQNARNGKTKAVYYATISGTSETGISVPNNGDRWKLTNENGWYTFKSKYPIYVDRPEDSDGNGTPAFLPGEMFYFEGKFKAFIDDVEIYEWTADYTTNTATENGFGELFAKRDFEPTGDYISDFNVSASGNTVTVSVDIRNCTKDNYTAQLFLVVYDGDTLDFVEMTEKTTITKTSDTSATPTKLEKSVTIPAGKTMKMFLWDSLEGMTPLKTCKLYE